MGGEVTRYKTLVVLFRDHGVLMETQVRGLSIHNGWIEWWNSNGTISTYRTSAIEHFRVTTEG